MGQKRYNLLNGLRFIAIIHIFLFHYFKYLFKDNQLLYNFVGSGFYSTSIFFILSGFMLYAVYSNKIEYPNFKKKFWTARFSKTYPLYLLTLAFYIPQYFLGGNGSNTVTQTVYTLLGVFLLQSWIPNSDIIYIFNYETWSLSVLYFFYMCFPSLVNFVRNKDPKKLLNLALAVWIIYFIPSFITLISGMSGDSVITLLLTRNPLFRIPEFLFGIILAKAAKEADLNFLIKFLNRNRAYLIIINLLIMIVGPFFIPELLTHNGLFLPLQGALILSLLYEKENSEDRVMNRIMNVLGGASLSFYLINAPLESIIRRIIIFFDLGNIKHYEHLTVFDMSEFSRLVSQFPSFASLQMPGLLAILVTLVIILSSVLIQKYFVNPVSKKIKEITTHKTKEEPETSTYIPAHRN
ncbi:MAG: acyltransferase family protein [Bacillota bacterium]